MKLANLIKAGFGINGADHLGSATSISSVHSLTIPSAIQHTLLG
jgi:hypothetical protein